MNSISIQIEKEKYKFLFILIIAILFFWRFGLFIMLPFVNTDGPWTLSKLFSFLNGNIEQSIFAHAFLGDIFKTHIFEIINAPFFLLYPKNTFSIIIHNFLLIAISMVLIYKIFNKKVPLFLYFLTSISILTSTYTYGMRAEAYCTPVLLLMILTLSKIPSNAPNWRQIVPIFIGAIVSLMHPAAAIAVGIIILYWLTLIRSKPIIYIYSGIAGIVFLLLLSQGSLLDYIALYSSSNELDDHSFVLSLLPKFFLYSLGIIPVLLIAIKTNIKYNIPTFFVFCIALAAFGRSYYFYYLFPLFITMIVLNYDKIKIQKNTVLKILTLSIAYPAIASFFSHINPTIIQIENPEYSGTFHRILKETRNIHSSMSSSSLLWVPSQLGMEVIHHPNTRLHFHFYKRMAGSGIKLHEGDAMLFFSHDDLQKGLSKLLDNTPEELTIEEKIGPVDGLLRIGTFYEERSDPLGLWMVKRNQEQR